MHPMCYFRTDNIEVGPQPVTETEIKLQALLPLIATAKHADLDRIMTEKLFCRVGPRREVLAQRRANARNIIAARIRNAQEGAINAARRAKFIGPLTYAMMNGHPF